MGGFENPACAHVALQHGWTNERILDLHKWGINCSHTVTSTHQHLVVIDGRFIAYPDVPLERLNEAMERATNPNETALVYTDGSGTTDDKEAGIGVVVFHPHLQPILISENIGLGTNNRAELTAIQRALKAVPDIRQSILIGSDSEFAIGASTKDWRMTTHQRLAADIKLDLSLRRAVRFQHVKGHSGLLWNEVADRLAKAGRLREEPKYTKKIQKAMKEYIP